MLLFASGCKFIDFPGNSNKSNSLFFLHVIRFSLQNICYFLFWIFSLKLSNSLGFFLFKQQMVSCFSQSNIKLRWNCGNILEYFRLSIYFTCVSVSLSIQSMFKFIKSNQSTINYIYRRICCCPFASERNLCFSMKKWWNK